MSEKLEVLLLRMFWADLSVSNYVNGKWGRPWRRQWRSDDYEINDGDGNDDDD